MRDDTRERDQYETKIAEIFDEYKVGYIDKDTAIRKIFGVFAELMG